MSVVVGCPIYATDHADGPEALSTELGQRAEANAEQRSGSEVVVEAPTIAPFQSHVRTTSANRSPSNQKRRSRSVLHTRVGRIGISTGLDTSRRR